MSDKHHTFIETLYLIIIVQLIRLSLMYRNTLYKNMQFGKEYLPMYALVSSEIAIAAFIMNSFLFKMRLYI